MNAVEVRQVDARATHDLRRRILRAGVPAADVDIAADHEAHAWHLGAFAGDRLVGVVSFYEFATPHRPGRPAEQFRFMAVESDFQGCGVGRELLTEGFAEATRRGADLVWANARDSALGFYTRLGFVPVGEPFVHEETGLPHTIVVRELAAPVEPTATRRPGP